VSIARTSMIRFAYRPLVVAAGLVVPGDGSSSGVLPFEFYVRVVRM
jgi:hypothetical protein